MEKETKGEERARIFPTAIKLIRDRIEAGEANPHKDDVASLRTFMRSDDIADRIEIDAHLRARLTDLWPAAKTREGRAKWADYPLLAGLGEEWREIGCRPYVIQLKNGTEDHRCLFEMDEKDRNKQVIPKIDELRAALDVAKQDVLDFNKQMRKLGCPRNQTPADFFAKKAPPAAMAAE